MKILIVIGAPSIGGAQRVAFNMSEWFNRQTDCHATVVSLLPAKEDKYDTSSLEVIELCGRNTIQSLRKVIKAQHPDIVLTMTVPLCVYTVPALFGLKVKHVISERTAPSRSATKGMTRVLSRLLMRTANGYVFQTAEARDYYGGRIANNSAVIPNPLFDTDQMPVIQYDGEDTKTIVTAGRLNEVKNHPMLIESFKDISERYPDYKLIIYGSGPEKTNDEKLVKKLGLMGKVKLPGSTNNIIEALYNTSMFILTSNYEGMPNALMEAMALGLPCISTDCPCGGPRELIKDGENGMLVPVGDKAALVKAIENLIEDRKMALRMGLKALEIRNTYSMDVICKQWQEFFKKVVEVAGEQR